MRKFCTVDDCDRWPTSQGLCGVHYSVLINYKLEPERHAALLDAQGGVCAICGGTNPDGSRLHIDHDHSCCDYSVTCGQCIRGLLCRKCNRSMAAVDRMGLNAIVDYLTNPPIHKV